MSSEFGFIRWITVSVVMIQLVLGYYAISIMVKAQLNPHLQAAHYTMQHMQQTEHQMVAALQSFRAGNHY